MKLEQVFRDIAREISSLSSDGHQQMINNFNFLEWYVETMLISNDYIVGKLLSPWTENHLDFRSNFINIEEGKSSGGKRRYFIRFTLSRNQWNEIGSDFEKLAKHGKLINKWGPLV